ncbi:MAG: TraR/DksA family transcriptional regulator [Jatrophihabitans sp.]|uniref:TraR/DksA family transcriptional regulator n=1 Tax=Jatrophihabitans sp. TaxID=1932789 RepID=UPI003F7D5850
MIDDHVTQRLSPAHLAALRAELEQQRAFRADQLLQLARPEGGPFASADHEVAQALRAGARAAFFAVQRALWRIEEGTYGRCTECNAHIPLADLQAVPHADRCLPCRQAASPG